MLCYLYMKRKNLKLPFLYRQAKLIFIHLFIRQNHDLSGKEGKDIVSCFQELSQYREVIMYLRGKYKVQSLETSLHWVDNVCYRFSQATFIL